MSVRAILLPLAMAAAACSPDSPSAPPPFPTEGGPPTGATSAPEFGKCAACHNITEGGRNGIGPNLYGVFGRPAASARPDYTYSPALRDSGLTWDSATLDRFLENPRAVVPGTKMTFAGIRDPEKREAVIALLRSSPEARP